jgi:hypothetical protein
MSLLLQIENLEPRYYCAIDSMMGPISPIPTNSMPLFPDHAVVDFSLDELYQNITIDNAIEAKEIKSLISHTTEDDDIVDRFEFLQLRRYIKNMVMPDHVGYLSMSVVYGHATNASIGNLQMWDGKEKVFSLIDKWFNGNDLPYQNHGVYETIEGELFVDGISAQDAKQGILNDCYFITALGSISQNSPETIENMFHEIDTNVWAIGFYDNYRNKHFVSVNNKLPANSSKDSVFASFSGNELWPSLLEKAYAQVSQNKGFRSKAINDYYNIEWGDTSRAIYHITFERMSIIKGDVKDQYVSYIDQNIPITVSYKNHTYTFESYDVLSDKFFLRNPYQTNHINMTWEELKNIGIVGDRQGGYLVQINKA